MRARVVGGLGVLLTLAAAAVVVAPGLTGPLPAAVEVVESRDPARLLLVLGSVVGAYAAWAARASPDERPPTDGPSARFSDEGPRPESVSAADRVRTGESFDGRVAAACDGDDRALRAVRATLADTAASARARAADRSPEQARREVETGAWTDDPTAAAFLADESGPRFSLVARLRAWLDPAAERRRRVERTVEAVRGVLDGGHDDDGGPAGREVGGEGESADAKTAGERDVTDASAETADASAERGDSR